MSEANDQILDEVKAPSSPPIADLQAKREEQDFQLGHDARQWELKARKSYANWLLGLIIGYIFFVLLIVFLAGYADGFASRGPKISESVQIALISGLSVNVIGLLTVVVAYLFPRRDK